MTNWLKPDDIPEAKLDATDIKDLEIRVRLMETQQRILGARISRLLETMYHHNKALENLEHTLRVIVKALKIEERPEVDA